MYSWKFNKHHSGAMGGLWYHDTKPFEITEELWDKACNCINSMIFELEVLGRHTEKLEGDTPGITVYYRSDYVNEGLEPGMFYSSRDLMDSLRNPDAKEVGAIIDKAFAKYRYEDFSQGGGIIETDHRPVTVSFTRPFDLEESNERDERERQERYRRQSAVAATMDQPVC